MISAWPTVKLSEVLRLVVDEVLVDAAEEYPMAGVYSFGRGLFRRESLSGSGTTYKVLHKLHRDDYVLSQLKAWEGALARVPEEFEGSFLSPQFPTFRGDSSRLDVRFLEWAFRQPRMWEQLKRSARGMGARRDSVSPRSFLEVSIPLPPLTEQRRIVARIEQLAAKLEEAKRLQADCTREVEALQRAALASTARTLSERFGTQPLRELIRQAGYGTSAKCRPEREPGAIPVLRIPNIAAGRVDLGDMKYGSLTIEELQRLAVAEGDLLLVRTNGSLDLVGRCAVVPALAEPTAYASYLIRLRVVRSLVDPNFLQLMLKHLRTQGELVALARTTAGQYNVSLGRLESARIPLPDLPRQHEVVQYHSSLRSKTEGLWDLRRDVAAEMEAATSAFLSKALSGEI